MARYLGPRLRIVRRFGDLPGLTAKVPTKKAPPGQHGPNQKKQQKSSFSDYKIRLFADTELRKNIIQLVFMSNLTCYFTKIL